MYLVDSMDGNVSQNYSPPPPKNVRATVKRSSSRPKSTYASTNKTSHRPRKFFHGTTMPSALEILKTGLWLVGDPKPRGIYITDDFDLAKHYAEKNGGIVIISVSSFVKLTDRGNRIFVYEIPGAQPLADYYSPSGISPVGIFDTNKNRIK